jgi:formylglycine-generating enzyme required for sulfatase activity
MGNNGEQDTIPLGPTHHPAAEQLRAYALGELPAIAVAALEEHLQTCDTCCLLIEDTLQSDLLYQRVEGAAAQGWLSAPAPVMSPFVPPRCSPQRVAEVPAVLAGHPRYEVLERIGRGGMGEVWKARHRIMQRFLALKVLSPDLLRKPEMVARFQREALAAARLDHPHIVRAYEAEQVGDTYVLVMEYVEGSDLARLVGARGPLPVAEACDYVRQAALGLQHAASQGVVHRDIKPANLMCTPQRQIKILDFGLAGLRDHAGEPLTACGTAMGTPAYLAPEQARDARQADMRSDLYGLGGTLFTLLTGKLPGAVLTGEGVAAALANHRSDVPPALAAVVERMLAPDPAQRFQTPPEVIAALTPFADKPRDRNPCARHNRRRRRLRWLLLGAALLLLGAAAFVVLRPQPEGPALPGTIDEVPGQAAEHSRFTNSVGMQFVLIPAGSFWMGAPQTDSLRFPPEGPQRRVTISRPFYLGVYEVTQGQYKGVMGKNPSKFDAANGGGPEHPVDMVSWTDAVEFCRLLSEQPAEKNAGRVYRLPTEAEWEYACRAGTDTRYSFGDEPDELAPWAWFKDNANGRSHPVGQLPANAWGLHDMHGNVWEWCADRYDADYYQLGPAIDPPGAVKAERGVWRASLQPIAYLIPGK